MQFYDIVMFAVMGGAILFGLWKGLAWQIASLAAIFVSYFVARNFNQPVAEMIGGDPAWNRFLAMFILFMGSSLVIWLLFGFVRNTIDKLHLNGFDRQAGAAVGGVTGLILCSLITIFSVSLLGESTRRQVCTSFSGNYIARVLEHSGGVVPTEISKFIDPYIDNFQNEFEEHQNANPQPQQNNGQFPGPNDQFNWGGQGMTQNGGPSERVGQLQRIPGNQPNSQPSVTGQFQLPTLDEIRTSAERAAQDAARDAAGRVLQDTWERVQQGGGGR